MKESNILKRGHEEIVLLCKSMRPEERLVAYFEHSQLVHQMYQAGVNYRSAFFPSHKRRTVGRR